MPAIINLGGTFSPQTQNKTVSVGSSALIVTPDPGFLLSSVTVQPTESNITFDGTVTKCGDSLSLNYGQSSTITIPSGYHLGALFIRQQSSNVATTDGDSLLTIAPTGCTCQRTAYHRWPNNSTNAWNINEQCLMYLVHIPNASGATILLTNRGSGNYNSAGAELWLYGEVPSSGGFETTLLYSNAKATGTGSFSYTFTDFYNYGIIATGGYQQPTITTTSSVAWTRDHATVVSTNNSTGWVKENINAGETVTITNSDRIGISIYGIKLR